MIRSFRNLSISILRIQRKKMILEQHLKTPILIEEKVSQKENSKREKLP